MKDENVIKYTGTSFINFREFDFENGSSHRFQWIDIKVFDLVSSESDNQTILAALIASTEYRDDYVGGGVDPEGTRHGPYWLDKIPVDAYEQVGEATAIELVERWMSECGTIPVELQESVDRQVFDPIRTATDHYVLKRLGKSAVNDYGDLHREFHEIVLIDRKARSALLVVASDD